MGNNVTLNESIYTKEEKEMAFRTSTKSTEGTGREKIKFEVLEELGTAFTSNGYEVKVRYIKWGDNEPKYDIRKWKAGEEDKNYKIATFTGEELEALTDLLIKIKEA